MIFLLVLLLVFCSVWYICSVTSAIFFTLALWIIRQFIGADADLPLYLLEKYGSGLDGKMRGKVVWITGGSRGIGAALAIKLVKCGAKIALSARDTDKMQQVKQHCIEAGASSDGILLVPLDVMQHDQHQTALQQVLDHFGELHILCSNAGRSQRAAFNSIDISVDRALFELNVFSLIALVRVVDAYFHKRGSGHHVVTSSTAGKLGAPMSSSYTASKHALHGYFECLRIESGGTIDITMLCPGPVESDIVRNCFSDKLGQASTDERRGKRMSAERCADLSAVAIHYKLPEVWIAEQPIVTLQYIVQYCPIVYILLFRFIGLKRIMKMRDGKKPASADH